MIYVKEIHGSTKREYIYFIKDNEIIHVSQLPKVKLAGKKDGNKKKITWLVPDDIIANNEGILILFSNNRYASPWIFKLPEDLSKYKELSASEIIGNKCIMENYRDPIRDIIIPNNFSIRYFGPEKPIAEYYLEIVPNLINDLWKDLRIIGIDRVNTYDKAVRTKELVDDYRYAWYMSLFIPSPHGRRKSLIEKITKAYELWLLGKALKALYELGFNVEENTLWLSHFANKPAIKMRKRNDHVWIIYQASLAPHVIPGYLNLPKPFHVIPDILLVMNPEEKYIEWGELAKHADKIPLLIEAKLSLRGITTYDRPDVALNQVKMYLNMTKHKPLIIIAIHDNNPTASAQFNSFRNLKAIDGLNPNTPWKVEDFKNLIKSLIKEWIERHT